MFVASRTNMLYYYFRKDIFYEADIDRKTVDYPKTFPNDKSYLILRRSILLHVHSYVPDMMRH